MRRSVSPPRRRDDWERDRDRERDRDHYHRDRYPPSFSRDRERDLYRRPYDRERDARERDRGDWGAGGGRDWDPRDRDRDWGRDNRDRFDRGRYRYEGPSRRSPSPPPRASGMPSASRGSLDYGESAEERKASADWQSKVRRRESTPPSGDPLSEEEGMVTPPPPPAPRSERRSPPRGWADRPPVYTARRDRTESPERSPKKRQRTAEPLDEATDELERAAASFQRQSRTEQRVPPPAATTSRSRDRLPSRSRSRSRSRSPGPPTGPRGYPVRAPVSTAPGPSPHATHVPPTAPRGPRRPFAPPSGPRAELHANTPVRLPPRGPRAEQPEPVRNPYRSPYVARKDLPSPQQPLPPQQPRADNPYTMNKPAVGSPAVKKDVALPNSPADGPKAPVPRAVAPAPPVTSGASTPNSTNASLPAIIGPQARAEPDRRPPSLSAQGPSRPPSAGPPPNSTSIATVSKGGSSPLMPDVSRTADKRLRPNASNLHGHASTSANATPHRPTPPPPPRRGWRPTPAPLAPPTCTWKYQRPAEVEIQVGEEHSVRVRAGTTLLGTEDWEDNLNTLRHRRALLTHEFQTLAASFRLSQYDLGLAEDELYAAKLKTDAADINYDNLGPLI